MSTHMLNSADVEAGFQRLVDGFSSDVRSLLATQNYFVLGRTMHDVLRMGVHSTEITYHVLDAEGRQVDVNANGSFHVHVTDGTFGDIVVVDVVEPEQPTEDAEDLGRGKRKRSARKE